MQSIHISDSNNSPAIFFNTGLDSRSFARTKMSQNLIEPGYIVKPDGSHEVWKAAGVEETDGIMQVWGPLFNGKRLDLLINEISSLTQEDASINALQAIALWIKAKMFLGDTRSVFNPGAAFICADNSKSAYPKDSVFFSPENLSNRCLFIEGTEVDRFNSPDLLGLEAAAFCAGVMLYIIFAKTHPYPERTIFQDMREGIFMPMHLAVPDLDEKLSGLIQSALMLPVASKKPMMSAIDILTEILKILVNDENKLTAFSSLFQTVSAEKSKQIETEKNRYLLKQNGYVRTKRFIIRNKTILTGAVITLIFLLIIVFSTIDNRNHRPTTAGMYSDSVVFAYFNAFSNLDHMFMEACLWGADRSDLNAAISLFALVRTRQAYEFSIPNPVPAAVWRDNGGELPSPNVFGVTDLTVTHIGGSDENGLIIYRAEYMVWSFIEDYPLIRSDIITLRLDRRNNWRITEILRTER